MGEWNYLILSSSVSWLSIFRFFGKGPQTAETSRISLQTWALLWFATLATWKLRECCYWSLQNCFCLPTAERPTKFGLVRLSERRFHCGNAVDAQSGFPFFAWRRSRWAVGDFFWNSCHHVASITWTRVPCCLTGRRSLQNEELSASHPHPFPDGSPGMSRERFLSGLELAGSEETH